MAPTQAANAIGDAAPNAQEWDVIFSVASLSSLCHKFTVDSSASRHLTNDKSHLHKVRPFNLTLALADGKTFVQGTGIGDIIVNVGGGTALTLKDVVLVPSLAGILLSVRKL